MSGFYSKNIMSLCWRETALGVCCAVGFKYYVCPFLRLMIASCVTLAESDIRNIFIRRQCSLNSVPCNILENNMSDVPSYDAFFESWDRFLLLGKALNFGKPLIKQRWSWSNSIPNSKYDNSNIIVIIAYIFPHTFQIHCEFCLSS